MKLVGILLLVAGSAFGSILFVAAPGPEVNNSLQAATRVLELGATGTESGCISWNGVADVAGVCTLGGAGFSGGDEKPASQTRTAGELGIVDGSDLRIVFDALEPSGNSITLDALRLIILHPTTGAPIYSADLDAPHVFASTLAGGGQTDGLFKLDASQAAALDAAVDADHLLTFNNIRIGLYANLSDNAGGFEGFYIGNRTSFDPGGVPEPSTLLLSGLGLAAIIAARRSKK